MNKIVFTYGRMNPPTLGHQKLIKKVQDLAKDADHMVFLSQTQNSITDPLSWDYKLKLSKAAFPDVNFCEELAIKTPYQALEYLTLALNYTDITFVVGADRFNEFKDSMTIYAKIWGAKEFKIVSAGKRNFKSKGVTGVSSSKLRYYAFSGDEKSFCKGLPSTIDMFTKKQVFRDVESLLRIT